MSQQLYLFSSEPLSEELQGEELQDADSLLVAQTRELFHHSGSNAELIDRIQSVIQAIDEHCKEPALPQVS